MTTPTLQASRLLETQLAPAKILIVDDVPQNLLAMRALLEGEEVQVLTAQSCAEALELLLENDVAVALLDVNMPEINGFDLAELMRSSPRTSHVPIIFLTASPQDPGRAFQGYESGAVDFLHKPIEPHVILSKVRVFVELHQQRAMLREHNERLKKSLELNETMIAVMTHDLRTPLTVISLNAQMLGLGATAADTQTVAHRIESSADRMARMIQQLLDFTRIRSGILRLEKRDADLRDAANRVVTELLQTHPKAQVETTYAGSLTGVFDADRVEQILSNMVGNALQNATGGVVNVHVDGSSPDTLVIEVRNDGQVPEDLLPRLFEPFKGSFHATQGLGLGLYIVDQFARAHGGFAEARNTPGQVIMRVQFPRASDAKKTDV